VRCADYDWARWMVDVGEHCCRGGVHGYWGCVRHEERELWQALAANMMCELCEEGSRIMSNVKASEIMDRVNLRERECAETLRWA